MSVDLSTINGILDEHQVIKHYLQVLSNSANELETFILQRAGEWDSTHLRTLVDKQFNLQEGVAYLHDGILRHDRDEDNVLPSLVGDLLMEGLRTEHREMWRHLGTVESLLADARLEALGAETLLAKGDEIKRATESLRQVVEGHMSKEEGVLELVKVAMTASREKKS